MMAATNSTRRYSAAGLLAILLWSTTVAFGRSVTEQLGPLTTATCVYGLGGALGWVYWRVSHSTPRLSSFDRRYLLGCGGLFLLYMTCFYLAVGTARDRTQVLGVGLVNYLWPTITLLFSRVLLKIRADALFGPGVLVAAAGVVLVTTGSGNLDWETMQQSTRGNVTPFALGLASATSWGLYSTLSRKWGAAAPGSAVPAFMLVTGLALGLVRALRPEQSHWTSRALIELAYLAVGPNLAYILWERAMQRGDVILVVSCSYLTPLLSIIISSLYLSVTLGWRLWLGCGLVIIGALICNLSVRRARSQPHGE